MAISGRGGGRKRWSARKGRVWWVQDGVTITILDRRRRRSRRTQDGRRTVAHERLIVGSILSLIYATKGQRVGDSAVLAWVEVVVAKITWKAWACEVPWSLFL